ncbi:porin [Photobacterium rosenbergii]|uniref:Porin n=1 Tax=Photobacterium rosenbergii TaxID=294936 RepID=A0A2T3N6U1_9GAMM|nr:porin [Photobacterium rosenbergii]PSW08452.1 porin [Photobacterium rosenbergii]
MKRVALAVAVSSLLGTGYAQAGTIFQGDDGSTIDVYGRLAFNVTDKDSSDVKGKFDARLGLGGSQTVNDDVSVIGWAEYQVNAAEGGNTGEGNDSLSARYVWVGIDSEYYGKVTGGRVASGLIMFTDIVDVYAASDIAIARQVADVDPTATQVFRQDATLQYQNSAGYFDYSLAYIIGNDDTTKNEAGDVIVDNLKQGYNIAMRYTFDLGEAGKIAPVAVYQYDENDNGAEYYVWGIGGSYYIGDLVLGLVYSEDEVDYGSGIKSKDEVVEFTAVYELNDYWVLRGGYRWLDNSDGDELELSDTTLEAQYRLTLRSSIFASYVFRDGKDGDDGTAEPVRFAGKTDDDYMFLGLRYEY